MKKISIFIMLLVCAYTSAQNINDVLRFANEDIQGTPRYQAMGGAFGALGGDLSALNNNPAGSAIFNHGVFTVTGTNYNQDNTATYFGSNRNVNVNEVDLNQIGGVMVFNNNEEASDWNRVALAFNYDLVQNFENRIQVAGRSDQGIDSYFSAFANGLPLGNILLRDGEFLEEAYLDIGAQQGFADQQAFLGYFGGVIDPDTMEDDNITYSPNARYDLVDQQFRRTTTGFNSKYTLNLATQYRKSISLGASINIHDVFYDQLDIFTEDGYDPDSEIQFTTFDNYLRTNGSGFSFSLGTIIKLNETVRLGASYQSPTWYRLTDELSQRINSDLADNDIQFINFDIVNIFETYRLKTPGKLTGSLALVFGKQGLLSVDYGYQDMSQSRLRPSDDPNFATVNSNISSQLTGVSSVRVGGEYRIQRVSLRGGYRFEQSPYENDGLMGDLYGFSGGIGYDFGSSRLDLTVNRTEREMGLQLFDVGVTTPANIDRVNTNVSIGYTVNF